MSNLPLEIEYKYLIEMPDLDVLKKQPGFRKLSITQLYLALPEGLSPHGINCRIRKTTENGNTVYHENFKTTVTHLTRVEIESKIPESKYEELCKYIKDGYAPVVKTRLCFCLYGYTYEVDVFPFWQDKAFMEIEVKSESEKPPIPEFIKVIKDVSADKRYRNTSLSQMIFENNINL